MSRPAGGGIKPVSKVGVGIASVGAGVGRRSSLTKVGSAAVGAPRGRGLSKANKDAKSQPALREPTISASHLLSLLGGAGGSGSGNNAAAAAADLRGLFSGQDDRSKPAHNPHVTEFAPPRRRRASVGEEDIITGMRKATIHTQEQHQQPQHQPTYAQPFQQPPPPQQHHQQPNWQHNNNPSHHNNAPHPQSNYTSNSYPSYDSAPPPPGPAVSSHHPSMQSPEWNAPAPVGGGVVKGSPAEKNRARAMGSTIFNASSVDDLPSNTITGHFRGRVSHGNDGYLLNSSMMNQDPTTRRPPPSHAQAQHDEQKSEPTRDPYARQQQHQNPYDTRDPSIYTQRAQQHHQPPPASHMPMHAQQPHHSYRPPPVDAGYYSPPHSPSRQPQFGDAPPHPHYESPHRRAASAFPSGATPPRSPSHAPRASWGGGDVSHYEVGTLGHRDEVRRKREEMRAILDQQIKEKQAAGGGAPGGSKSTKYAIRHRERQAELAFEQQRASQTSPSHMHQQPAYAQPTFGYNNQPPPHQQPPHAAHNQYPPQQQYQQPSYPAQQPPQHYSHPPASYGSAAPPSSDTMLLSPNGHGRFRSDLHAGAAESAGGANERMRAQIEFREHLAAQVREKEAKKAEAKRQKDEEDRAERIRLGLDQPPPSQMQPQMQQPPPPHFAPPNQQSYPPQHSYPPNGYDQNSGGYPPQQISPSHGGPNGSSPSKVAANRGRQMNSNIFADGGMSAADQKAHERQLAQQALAEQIESRRLAKAEVAAREAEMERRDNERIARERLEMISRFQGADPVTAAQKAQQMIAASQGNESHSQPPAPEAGRSPQQQLRSAMVSPSNAKTQIASVVRADAGEGHLPAPSFDFADEDASSSHGNEEHIARLTALTSAMNKKVESRRAKAQQFEDSGLLDEGAGEVNLDEYEEVPRRVNGVAVAGRRGGKQGPSNKPAAKKPPPGPPAALKARHRSASHSRRAPHDDREGARERDRSRGPPPPAKKTAAQRERDREAEMLAAAQRRKASILARARREVDEEGDDDNFSNDDYSSRRASVGRDRRPQARSTKPTGAHERRSSAPRVAAVGRRVPRVSSASVSSVGGAASASVSRRGGYDDYDDDDYDPDSRQYDDESDLDSRRDRARGHTSRIPRPRVQSGKKRKPLSASHVRPERHRSPARVVAPHARQQQRTNDYSHQQTRSPQRHQQPPPPHNSHVNQHAGAPRSVSAADYPWFAQAASGHSALDVSLSGNSAFILLPSSSAHVLPSEGPSVSSARAPASVATSSGVDDEDGILPDELDRLMRRYGQTGGIENVFDNSILPAPPAPVTVPSVPVASARRATGNGPISVRQGSAASKSSARSSRVGIPSHAASNLTPRLRTPVSVDPDEGLLIASEGGPLSPGGESLEVGSQEWLAGSIISPADAANEASDAAIGGLHASNSRSSLVRPMPRVVDPFSRLMPE